VCVCAFVSVPAGVFVYLPLSPESGTEGHSSGKHVQLDQTTPCLHRPPGAQSKFIHLTKHETDIVRFIVKGIL